MEVQRGYGSFVTMEFGEPHVTIREARLMPVGIDGGLERALSRHASVHGDWHLWVYQCQWSLSLHDTELAHSESRPVPMNRALHVLDGQALTGIKVDPASGSSRFAFDLGCTKAVAPYVKPDNDEPDKLWLLYEPSGQVLAIRSDGCYCRAPGSSTRDQHQWIPIAVPVTIGPHDL